MNTYFITYTTGEYDSFTSHVYSIDADSKDAIMDEVITQIHAFRKTTTDYNNAKEKALGSYPKPSSTNYSENLTKYYDNLVKFTQEFGYDPNGFQFFEYIIQPFDGIVKNYSDIEYYPDINEILNMASFEIYDVEEYISECRPRKA